MYTAVVARLTNVREHPNAQRLQLATVLGSQVVVGIDANEGELGIYFPTDGKLSPEYCTKNDLYPRYEIDDAGKKTKVGGGMFDPKNSRVRAQNLRSVKSDGYFASLDSVAYTGINLTDLYEGYQFHTLNDHLICEKYYTPQTLRAMKGGTKPLRKKNIMFAEHVDTEQYAYKKSLIQPGAICTITEKIHGTSHRIGNVIDETEKRPWYRKILGLKPKVKREWKDFHGTRRVVLGEHDERSSYYGTDEFRYKATESLEGNLRKGEVVYGEIVGYVDETRLVMGETSTKDLRKDPEFKALFNPVPDTMKYTYNCVPGECDFYVYRITQVDEDGHAVELSWPQVKARCSELGVKHVPQLFGPTIVREHVYWLDPVDEGYDPEVFGLVTTNKPELAALDGWVDEYQQGVSTIDPTTIREGVVVRVDQPDGTVEFLKAKQYYFKVLESIIKANEDYVDTEEVS